MKKGNTGKAAFCREEITGAGFEKRVVKNNALFWGVVFTFEWSGEENVKVREIENTHRVTQV